LNEWAIFIEKKSLSSFRKNSESASEMKHGRPAAYAALFRLFGKRPKKPKLLFGSTALRKQLSAGVLAKSFRRSDDKKYNQRAQLSQIQSPRRAFTTKVAAFCWSGLEIDADAGPLAAQLPRCDPHGLALDLRRARVLVAMAEPARWSSPVTRNRWIVFAVVIAVIALAIIAAYNPVWPVCGYSLPLNSC
jgi:hypothetical protein